MHTAPALTGTIGFLVWCRRNTAHLAWTLVAINLLLPAALALYAALSGKAYWNVFQGERNVITWYSSIQLILVALVAYANFELSAVLRSVGAGTMRRWIWLLFCVAFVFFAMDERFEIHEFIRDRILRPANVAADVPGLRAGDITMYIYLLGGAVASVFVIEALRHQLAALALFFSAVSLSCAFVLVDTLEPTITGSWIWPRFWTSAFEEVAEIWAQALFVLSFLSVFSTGLKRLVEQGQQR